MRKIESLSPELNLKLKGKIPTNLSMPYLDTSTIHNGKVANAANAAATAAGAALGAAAANAAVCAYPENSTLEIRSERD